MESGYHCYKILKNYFGLRMFNFCKSEDGKKQMVDNYPLSLYLLVLAKVTNFVEFLT